MESAQPRRDIVKDPVTNVAAVGSNSDNGSHHDREDAGDLPQIKAARSSIPKDNPDTQKLLKFIEDKYVTLKMEYAIQKWRMPSLPSFPPDWSIDVRAHSGQSARSMNCIS
ncbi:hypothetical protein VaNZ11_010738 [Volvox africanus]|uniref:Uncharacterized protein n=1 Tax=Volvox africanus TaxID=51714 RepID=A0ABQ5SBE3_9CHLO|nr:hypothetical protein VaNZ11_010738 [Volvox africanus]